MSFAVVRIAVVLLPLLTCGCSVLPQGCAPPARAMISAEILFGRDIGNRIAVSESDFAAFTAAEITPRFPDGLTIIDTRGQWRDPARNRIVLEPGKLVKMIFDDQPQKRAALEAIVSAYKNKFHQQAVLTTLHSSCVTF
jgi:Protein of unknown function (DUF3574)